MDRALILAAIERFVARRSGLDRRNYSDAESYRVDAREIARDGKSARAMLRAIERSMMPAETLMAGFSANAGRMTFSPDTGIEYVCGQHWPTEYRSAACSVLARALHLHWANGITIDRAHFSRREAERTLGRRIAAEWF